MRGLRNELSTPSPGHPEYGFWLTAQFSATGRKISIRGPWDETCLVRAVAAGEMTWRNDKLLLHVELIDVEDGAQLWGEQFEESCSDVLISLEKLADRICDQLRLILAPNRKKALQGTIRLGSAA